MGSTGITGLPGGFGQLLTEVHLGGCKQLQTLCENFRCLKNLHTLFVWLLELQLRRLESI